MALRTPWQTHGNSFHGGWRRRQDGSLGSRTLRPLWQDSGKTRLGQVYHREVAIRNPPLHAAAELYSGLGHGHSAPGSAGLSLTMGAQSIHSAQLTLNKTLSRDILLSSPYPLFIYWAEEGVKAQE